MSHYEKKLGSMGTEEERFEYMMQCAPYIHEYSTIIEENVLDKNFPLVFKTNTKKQELYQRFLEEVDGVTPNIVSHEHEFHTCQKCGGELLEVHQTSTVACLKCGVSISILGEELSYKEEQTIQKNVTYSYKRENHFNEWISQFQGTESTTIPQDVIEQLRYEFKKQKITSVGDITHTKVRALLKKLKLNKYYEHVPYISTILSGNTPPRMPSVLEDKLRLMFAQIQEPFEKNCPKDRKNFLSYSYVLYKFCELLGEDEYLPHFPLLKSKDKLRQQDILWCKIANELQWEYIPTT